MQEYLAANKINLIKHPNGGYIFYTVEVHYGNDNVWFPKRKFLTLKEVTDWRDKEYPAVPFCLDKITTKGN